MPRRANTTVDVGRLAQAVSRPGIDTRVWCCLGYAKADAVLDAEHGWMVDVVMLPSSMETTARCPQSNAGGAFGHSEGRILKDDEVALVFPDGDPAAGAFVIARCWSMADKPPELAVQNADDIVRVLKKDTSYRLKLTGSGLIRLEAEGKAFYAGETVTLESGKVRLGGEDATEQYVMGTTYRASEATMNSTVSSAHTAEATSNGLLIAVMTALAPVGALLPPPVGAALTAALTAAGTGLGSTVAAETAAAAAINAHEGQSATFLSGVTKGK